MNLMATDPTRTLDFSSPAFCRNRLADVRVTDPAQAAALLTEIFEGMAAAAPPPLAHFEILESQRATLDYVQGELAKRYASHPLPPSSREEETLRRTVRLWQLMVANYSFIAQRLAQSASTLELPFHPALLWQRRLHYQSQMMLEFFRARRQMPEGQWLELHTLYRSTVRAGHERIRVNEPVNETWGAQSPQEAYVALLLVDAASPYSRTAREFNWVLRWAQRFAPYCLLQESSGSDSSASYLLDPQADCGLRPALAVGVREGVQSLDARKLAAHIQAVVSRLKEGESAASLGLGDDCVQPACARLLVSLYRPWGLAASGRKFPRRQQRGQVQLCADLEAAAFFISGKKFEQPETQRIRGGDFRRTLAILALGEQVEATEPSPERLAQQALALGYVQESWEVLDQSVAGFRIARHTEGARIEHRQLLGLRPATNEPMLLAEVSWLQYQANGALHAGISMLPGPALVVRLRQYLPERAERNEAYRLGFLLPGVPALKMAPSLLLPAGWNVPGRMIEVQGEEGWLARLEQLQTRGANFDRVIFTRSDLPASLQTAP